MRYAFCSLLCLHLSACSLRGAPRSPTSGVPAGVDIVWVVIPGGKYPIGCSPGDEICFPDERPRHTRELAGFEIAATETTQAQYRAATGASPSSFAGCDDCPVEGLTWGEAARFCQAVGGRLPTEAEWEVAARANTTTRYPCGDDPACLDAIAWYKPNAAGATHRVKQKRPNAFGLYDTLGNVLEFVADPYAEDAYAKIPPNDAQAPMRGSAHVLRGGAWFFSAEFLRVSLRNHDGEPIVKASSRGVRCAREPR